MAHSRARADAGVWRYERYSGQSKLVGVKDAEVVKEIYTVTADDGSRDAVIEEYFCDVEGTFCSAREAVLDRGTLTKQDYLGLFRFVAAQLLRTPRALEAMQKGNSYQRNDLRGAMLILIDRWIHRLGRMRGIIAYCKLELPLLTSDNPVTPWSRHSKGFTLGATQHDENLVVGHKLTHYRESCHIVPACPGCRVCCLPNSRVTPSRPR